MNVVNGLRARLGLCNLNVDVPDYTLYCDVQDRHDSCYFLMSCDGNGDFDVQDVHDGLVNSDYHSVYDGLDVRDVHDELDAVM